MISALLISAAFAFAFILNNQVFNVFELSDFVALVFLPSGVRIFSVLVFDVTGAVGIFMGSLLISFLYLGQTNVEIAVCSGAIASGTALLSRILCVRWFQLHVTLQTISLGEIAKICVVFSVLSSVVHQVFYHANGLGNHFATDVLMMFIGDISGALIFVVATKYVVVLTRRFR